MDTKLLEKITAVSKTQRYICAQLDEDITLEALAGAAGYSKYHVVRIFKELTGRTPFEVIRAMRLTKAAQSLQKSEGKVVDVALSSGFDSHDGFTRAFHRQFAITPQKYQQKTPPVRWFVPYSIEAYYLTKEDAIPMPKEPISRTMTVTAIERPARKLILVRSVKATHYFEFCEEVGCEWEGLFNSIPEKFDTAALLTLPPNMIKPGTGNTASGVEIPLDYNKPIPEGCDVIELAPCTLLYFNGASFADEQDFGAAIGTLWGMMRDYDPTQYGWQYASELAPYMNFGAPLTGAKMAQPVKPIMRS